MINKTEQYTAVYAPFSVEEMDAINTYQEKAPYPYTCKTCHARLIAKEDGMSCEGMHDTKTCITFTHEEHEPI